MAEKPLKFHGSLFGSIIWLIDRLINKDLAQGKLSTVVSYCSPSTWPPKYGDGGSIFGKFIVTAINGRTLCIHTYSSPYLATHQQPALRDVRFLPCCLFPVASQLLHHASPCLSGLSRGSLVIYFTQKGVELSVTRGTNKTWAALFIE